MFYETNSIKLECTKIPEKTNGVYYVSKFFCNSLRSCYGMTDNFMNTKTSYDRNEFCDFVFKDQYDSNYIFIFENTVNLSYKKIEENLSAPTQINIEKSIC